MKQRFKTFGKSLYMCCAEFLVSHLTTCTGNAYVVEQQFYDKEKGVVFSPPMDYVRAIDFVNDETKDQSWTLMRILRVNLRTGKDKVIWSMRW